MEQPMQEDHQETNGNRVGIAYTVKELLSNLSDKIDRIETKLDNKVDRSELEVLNAKQIVLETKFATTEALKIQADQIAQLYLKQFEQLQKEVQELKIGAVTTAVVNKAKNDWKILWIPVLGNLVGTAALVYVALGGKL
jgi:hypothetical protein